MKGHLYLVGFMGAGKSAVSRRLAGALSLPCMDTDQEIEKRQGKTISQIFEEKGEEAFRDMESALLTELLTESPRIISCGGGLMLRSENRRMMKQSGRVCYLTAEPKTILERVSRNDNRPLLRGKKTPEAIQKLMEERKERYESVADFTVSTDRKSVEEVSEEIQRSLKD